MRIWSASVESHEQSVKVLRVVGEGTCAITRCNRCCKINGNRCSPLWAGGRIRSSFPCVSYEATNGCPDGTLLAVIVVTV